MSQPPKPKRVAWVGFESKFWVGFESKFWVGFESNSGSALSPYSIYSMYIICNMYLSNFSIDVFNKKDLNTFFLPSSGIISSCSFVDRCVRVPDGRLHQVDAESVIPSKWLPLRLQDVGLPRVFDWKMMDASIEKL